VDYIVQDWHTIHEDRTVAANSNTGSSTTNSMLRLTLNDLLNAQSPGGATDQVGNKFYGIGGIKTALGPSVIVYDADAGAIMPNTQYSVDYANGTISMNGVPPNEHVRVYYHSSFDWAISVLKPAANYTVTESAGVTQDKPTDTGQAIWDGVSGSASFGNLYFPQVDNGRMVQIGGTVTYSNPANATNPVTVPVSDLETLTLQPGQTLLSVSLLSAVGAPSGSTFVSAAPTVTGASLTARVIWREQDLWRHRDITTVQLPSGK
jgi:hypothetical protein